MRRLWVVMGMCSLSFEVSTKGDIRLLRLHNIHTIPYNIKRLENREKSKREEQWQQHARKKSPTHIHPILHTPQKLHDEPYSGGIYHQRKNTWLQAKQGVTGHMRFDWCGTRRRSRVQFLFMRLHLLFSSQIVATIAYSVHCASGLSVHSSIA